MAARCALEYHPHLSGAPESDHDQSHPQSFPVDDFYRRGRVVEC